MRGLQFILYIATHAHIVVLQLNGFFVLLEITLTLTSKLLKYLRCILLPT